MHQLKMRRLGDGSVGKTATVQPEDLVGNPQNPHKDRHGGIYLGCKCSCCKMGTADSLLRSLCRLADLLCRTSNRPCFTHSGRPGLRPKVVLCPSHVGCECDLHPLRHMHKHTPFAYTHVHAHSVCTPPQVIPT